MSQQRLFADTHEWTVEKSWGVSTTRLVQKLAELEDKGWEIFQVLHGPSDYEIICRRPRNA